MKKTLIAAFSLIISFLSVSLSHAQQGKVHYSSTRVVHPVDETMKEINYTYKIFKNNDGTFGYEILANGKTYFYQESYPGRTVGFQEKKTCEAIATLIIKKINSGKMIPAVNDRELSSYGITK